MWIRSQNLTVLVNAKEIYIDDKRKIWAEGYLIVKYSTKEKALKVLGDMESHLKGPYGILFEMPKDEDVEVWQKKKLNK